MRRVIDHCAAGTVGRLLKILAMFEFQFVVDCTAISLYSHLYFLSLVESTTGTSPWKEKMIGGPG